MPVKAYQIQYIKDIFNEFFGRQYQLELDIPYEILEEELQKFSKEQEEIAKPFQNELGYIEGQKATDYQKLLSTREHQEKVLNSYSSLYNNVLGKIYEIYQGDNDHELLQDYEHCMKNAYYEIFSSYMNGFGYTPVYGANPYQKESGIYDIFSITDDELAYNSKIEEMKANKQLKDANIINNINSSIDQLEIKETDTKKVGYQKCASLVDNYLIAKKHYESKGFWGKLFSFGEKKAIKAAETLIRHAKDEVFKEDKSSMEDFINRVATKTPEVQEAYDMLMAAANKYEPRLNEVHDRYREEKKQLEAVEKKIHDVEVKNKKIDDINKMHEANRIRHEEFKEKIKNDEELKFNIDLKNKSELKKEEKEFNEKIKKINREFEEDDNKRSETLEGKIENLEHNLNKTKNEQDIEVIKEKLNKLIKEKEQRDEKIYVKGDINENLKISDYEAQEEKKVVHKVKETTPDELLEKQIGQMTFMHLFAVKNGLEDEFSERYEALKNDPSCQTPDRKFQTEIYNKLKNQYKQDNVNKLTGEKEGNKYSDKVTEDFEKMQKQHSKNVLASMNNLKGDKVSQRVDNKVKENEGPIKE